MWCDVPVIPNCELQHLDGCGGDLASSADEVKSDDVAPSASCSPMLLRCSSLALAVLMSSGRPPAATPAAAIEGAGGGASELRAAPRPPLLRPRPLAALCASVAQRSSTTAVWDPTQRCHCTLDTKQNKLESGLSTW